MADLRCLCCPERADISPHPIVDESNNKGYKGQSLFL